MDTIKEQCLSVLTRQSPLGPPDAKAGCGKSPSLFATALAAQEENYRELPPEAIPAPAKRATGASGNHAVTSESARTATNKGTFIEVKPPSGGNSQHRMQITMRNGVQVELDIAENVRVSELDDGSLAVYALETGKTRLISPSGAVSEELREPGIVSTEGDDLIIQVKEGLVDGGLGNDTILCMVDNATLLGGEGDDAVLLFGERRNVKVDTGEGHDILVGDSIVNGVIDMGDGDDLLNVLHINNTQVQMGEGQNSLSLLSATGSIIRVGNGNNSINIESMYKTLLQIGEGKNSIYNVTMEDSEIRKDLTRVA